MQKLINCSLIGFGSWGKKLYRTLQKNQSFKIIYICKKNIKNFDNSKYKSTFIDSYKKAINDKVDAIFVASSSESHFAIVKYALERKKNVFVEKPICFKQKQFKLLQKLAKKNKLLLHINYIHLFNNNFISLIKNFNKNNNNKKKYSINILLGKKGPIRKKTSIIMDWGPHILSMINYILNNNKYIINHAKIVSKNNELNTYNVFLNLSYKSIEAQIIFGNKFNKKQTKLNIISDHGIYKYLDSNSIIIKKNNIKKIIKNKKSPLENSIENFSKKIKLKKFKSNPILDNITYTLEKLEKKLIR